MCKYYTIGEFSNKTGVPTSTLRYYDKEGVFPFVERTPSGQRMYKESDLEWLSIIECLKATGLTIREIRQYMDWYKEGDITLEKRLHLFEKQQKVLEAQIEDLQKKQYKIMCKIWYYKTALEAGTESIHDGVCTELYEKYMTQKQENFL